jgi:L-lactate dehydrogenase complex protein LldE
MDRTYRFPSWQPGSRTASFTGVRQYFFATCVVDQFFPGAGLTPLPCSNVRASACIFPKSKPAAVNRPIRAVSRRGAQGCGASADAFPENWPVVVPSGSCAGMMKHHYPTLFANDPARKAQAEKLSARIYEFTDFLVNVLGFQPEDQRQRLHRRACTPPARPAARWASI